MYYQLVYAQIDSNGVVRNRMVCDDFSTANEITRATYGEGAQAVEINLWKVKEGDVYKNNTFFEAETNLPCKYLPSVEDRLNVLSTQVNMIAPIMASMSQSFPETVAMYATDYYVEWSNYNDGHKFSVGNYVLEHSILYRVILEHVKKSDWKPSTSPSLFSKVLKTDAAEIREWEQPMPTNPYSKGNIVTHNRKTYSSLSDFNIWEPGVIGTESIWGEVFVGANSNSGELNDPIPYNPPMEIFVNSYYIEDDVVYKCIRNSGAALTHNLKDLVGLYVEKVEE